MSDSRARARGVVEGEPGGEMASVELVLVEVAVASVETVLAVVEVVPAAR